MCLYSTGGQPGSNLQAIFWGEVNSDLHLHTLVQPEPTKESLANSPHHPRPEVPRFNPKMCDAAVREGVAACPFLRRVAATQGQEFAVRLAINPLKPVVDCGPSSPLFPEDAMSFQSAFAMFHGARGVMPLAPSTARTTGSCSHAQPKAQPSRGCDAPSAPQPSLSGLPVASMSISGFGKLVSGRLCSTDGVQALRHVVLCSLDQGTDV